MTAKYTPSRSSSCSAREPGLAQEPVERLRRRDVARPLDLLAARLGRVGDVARDQHQPPRRRINVDRARLQPRRRVHSANSRASSLRARACIRAGISSDSSSSRKSATYPLPFSGRGSTRAQHERGAGPTDVTPPLPAQLRCAVPPPPQEGSGFAPATPRTPPSTGRARGRCRPGARRPRSLRAPAAC